MQAWKIFRHSWMMVFGNLGAAFRVSGVLFAVQLVFTLYWVSSVTGIVNAELVRGNNAVIAETLNTIVSTITSLWIAVAWHRYVLTGEQSKSWLPMFNGGRMWSYFWHSFLIMLAVFMPVGMILAAVVFGSIVFIPSDSWAGWSWILPLLIYTLTIMVILRLSVILPSVALGRRISLSDVWGSTKGATGTFAFFSILIVGITGASWWITGAFVGSFGIFSILWYGVVGWIQTMLSVSVLTTIYGHYVEGRALT